MNNTSGTAVLTQFWRLFRGELRAHRGRLLIALGAMLCGVALRVVEPWPIKFVFDWLINPQHTAVSVPEFVSTHKEIVLLGLVLAIVLLAAVRSTLQFSANVKMGRVASQIATAVRVRLFNHLQGLSLSFFRRKKTGDLVTHLTQDVARVRDMTATAVVPFFANAVTCAAMFVVMLFLNLQLALILLAIVPAFAIVAVRTTRRIRETVAQQRQHEGKMASSAAESLNAMMVVQSFSSPNEMHKQFAQDSEHGEREGASTYRLAASLSRQLDLTFSVATALVIWRGVSLVLAGELSPGTLLVFVSYITQIIRPIRQSAKQVANMSKARVSLERVLAIFNEHSDVVQAENPIPLPQCRGDVVFHEVCFHYPGNAAFQVKDCSFSIARGEKFAIVGPSGSGKSTLTSLLLRLYDPVAGRITMDSIDLRELRLETLRQQISVVLQGGTLFGMSIRDNIAFGKPQASEPEIVTAAKMAQLHTFICSLPKGYDTVLSERGETLSGGQRQRLALARAFIRNTPVLILDEPTTGLDQIAYDGLIETLKELWRDKTTLLVTHDERLLKHADKIGILVDGVMVAQGTYPELKRHNQVFRNLFSSETLDPGEG